MESYQVGIGKDESSRVSAEESDKLLQRQNLEIRHRGPKAPSAQAAKSGPVVFADNIALVIIGKYLEDLSNLFSVSFKKYQEYLDLIGQELAEHKTEAVLITSRKVGSILSSRWSMLLLRQQQ